MSVQKVTEKCVKGTTASDKRSDGFTDHERAAIKERAQELRAEARRAAQADKAVEAERAVLERIAEMPEPDRVVAERIHAIIKSSSPELSPKT